MINEKINAIKDWIKRRMAEVMGHKIKKLIAALCRLPIIIAIVAVIILGIAFGFEKASVIIMTVGLVSLVLIAIIVSIYVLHANFRPLDLSGLSKELEYFEIKKDIKKDIKIGWSSKEHYVFLYNSLSEHICGLDDRPAQISFLNAKIYNSELISNGSNSVNFLKLISVFFSFFSGYGLKDLLNGGDVSLYGICLPNYNCYNSSLSLASSHLL